MRDETPGRRPVRTVPLRAEVVEASSPGGRFRRLVLAGADLAGFVWSGPAASCKLIVPGPGHGSEVLPTPGGIESRLDRAQLTVRTYTPRRWEPGAGQLTIDVLVHPGGRAAHWADAAGPGDELAVTRALGGWTLPPGGPVVLAADESALPAVATILAEATGGASGGEGTGALPRELRVVVEVDGPPVVAALPGRPDLRVVAAQDRPGAALAAAVAEEVDGSTAAVWVACESAAMLGIRHRLLGETGLDRRAVTTRGYWTAGRPG